MNPLENEVGPQDEPVETAAVEPMPVDEIDATPVKVEPEVPAPVFLQSEDEAVEEFEEEEPGVEYIPAAVSTAPVFYQTPALYADQPRNFVEEATSWDYTHADDGGYYITVIEEKNTKQRNVLLLGASALALIVTVGGWGISLFQKELGVGAIGSDSSLAYLIDDVPMPVDDEQEKKDKEDAGGGGGGGKEEEDPVNQGDMPDQTKNPLRPPDPKTYRSDNFELKTPVPSTEGNKTFEKKYGQWGDPNSVLGKLSSGPGSGGGMGPGVGPGAGSGYGTGAGSGSGSGYGSGDGSGNGSGSGAGDKGPPPVRAAVTTPYKLLAKPKATYTDEARANSVQGTVRLKVTLLASGQVGSIVPVTRLPYGLTERAIAAARQIRFEPKMVNGVRVPAIVTFEYSFTMY